MTPLEAEALLVRYQAAVGQVETTDEQGRWALLDNVVDPSDELMLASLLVAEQRGVSKLAEAMLASERRLRDDRDRRAATKTEPASVAA